MKSVRFDYPLGLLCRVFGVSRSGFYAALERKPSQRAQDDERLKVAGAGQWSRLSRKDWLNQYLFAMAVEEREAAPKHQDLRLVRLFLLRLRKQGYFLCKSSME